MTLVKLHGRTRRLPRVKERISSIANTGYADCGPHRPQHELLIQVEDPNIIYTRASDPNSEARARDRRLAPKIPSLVERMNDASAGRIDDVCPFDQGKVTAARTAASSPRANDATRLAPGRSIQSDSSAAAWRRTIAWNSAMISRASIGEYRRTRPRVGFYGADFFF